MAKAFFVFLPIVLLIVSGWIIKIFIIKKETFWSGLNSIAYYVLLPLLLVHNIAIANIHASAFGELIIITVSVTFVIALSLLLLKVVYKFNGASFSSIFQGGIRYNSYILIGLFALFLPEQGVALFGILTLFMLVLTNLLSMSVLTIYCQGNNASIMSFVYNAVKNPLILATLLGLLLNLLSMPLPKIVYLYLPYLTNSTIVISLLIVGAGLQLGDTLSHIKFISLATIIKLFICPSVTLGLLAFFPVSHDIKLAAIIYAALPCAASSYILAKQMQGDAKLMAAIIVSTTSLGMLTLPLFIGLVL